jgi:multidrug resistance efflux pump
MESKEILQRIARQTPSNDSVGQLRPLNSPTEQAATATAKPPITPLDWAVILRDLHNHQDVFTRAAMLAHALAKQWSASRVVLVRNHSSKPLEVVGTSSGLARDISEIDRQRLMHAAQESRDQRATIWANQATGSALQIPTNKLIALAHMQLAKDLNGLVLSIPLGLEGQVQGVLMIEFTNEQSPLSRGAIAEHWESSLAVFETEAIAVASTVAMLFSQNDLPTLFKNPLLYIKLRIIGRNGLIACGLILAAAFLLPISDPISAPARIEGQIQRQLTSPTDGLLKAVHARPGDRVKAGQLIAELKERDFELERSRLQSERSAHDSSYRAAIAKGDRTAMILAQAKIDEVDAQLGLITTQIDSIQVRAPIDGVIISTDLSTLVGNAIERGQTLAVVAPENSFRVIIELDERDSTRVKRLQKGQLALSARPFESLSIQVDSISPAAISTESGNAIELQAKLVANSDQSTIQFVKPGLRGVVHLDNGQAPLAFIWYRQTSHYLRLWAWRWLPWLVS